MLRSGVCLSVFKGKGASPARWRAAGRGLVHTLRRHTTPLLRSSFKVHSCQRRLLGGGECDHTRVRRAPIKQQKQKKR